MFTSNGIMLLGSSNISPFHLSWVDNTEVIFVVTCFKNTPADYKYLHRDLGQRYEIFVF